MNAAITKAELLRLLPEPRSLEAEKAQGVFQAALRLRDALLATGVPQILARFGQRIAGRILVARAAAELRGLTDRELADIGLTRGDIPRVLNPTAPRPAAPARPSPAGVAVPA